MVKSPGKQKQTIFFLILPLWTILFLTGCSGSKTIPPASILTSGKVTLTWQNVPGASAYHIYLSTSPGVTLLNSYKISDVTNPITITDLEPGTTYYFVVTVEDESGQNQKSKEISYKVFDTAGSIQFGNILSHSAPDASISEIEKESEGSPVDVKPKPNPIPKDSAPDTQAVTLAWDEVPNATSYNIYWSDKPGVTKKNGTKITNVNNPHKIAGLKKGKKYYFTVTAVNASGESKESEEFSFTVGQ